LFEGWAPEKLNIYKKYLNAEFVLNTG